VLFRSGTPAWSLAAQGLIALAVVLGFELTIGKSEAGGFNRMVEYTLPLFWLFLLLVSLSLVVLRFREPDIARPHRAPLYPLTPLIFAGGCLFMLHASWKWAQQNGSPEPRIAFALLAAGAVVCAVDHVAGKTTGKRR